MDCDLYHFNPGVWLSEQNISSTLGEHFIYKKSPRAEIWLDRMSVSCCGCPFAISGWPQHVLNMKGFAFLYSFLCSKSQVCSSSRAWAVRLWQSVAQPCLASQPSASMPGMLANALQSIWTVTCIILTQAFDFQSKTFHLHWGNISSTRSRLVQRYD